MEWGTQPPDLLELLDGIEFPATKLDIVVYAEDNDASEEALELLRAMPDREYNSIRQINAGLGLIEDLPRTDDGWWPGEEPDTRKGDRRKKVSDTRGRGQL